MSVEEEGTYVSQKISKIRWIPEDYADTKSFFTGSWDDEVNSIKVWTFERINEEEEIELPKAQTEYTVDGDVTQIKFIDKNKIAVSLSNGEVKILEVSVYNKETPLREVYNWRKLHNYGEYPCSCTSLDTSEGDIATIGEDGNINILSGRRGEINRKISNADSASLQAVCYIKHNEVITGNIRGHMKIWDLRSQNDMPCASFVLAGDELAATCIINHPTQPHVVLAGSESGLLAVWDLRMNAFPTSLLKAHSAGITEMQFHPENPQKLITCSVSGEIWDWNMEALIRSAKGPDNQLMAWMQLDDKNELQVTSLMPTLFKAVNTVHCDKSRILWGTDSEAIYLIKDFKY